MGPPLPAPGNGRAARGFPAELGGGGVAPSSPLTQLSPRKNSLSPRPLASLSPSHSALSERLDSLRVTRLSPSHSALSEGLSPRGGGGGPGAGRRGLAAREFPRRAGKNGRSLTNES